MCRSGKCMTPVFKIFGKLPFVVTFRQDWNPRTRIPILRFEGWPEHFF